MDDCELRVFNKKTLREYQRSHPEAAPQLAAWFHEVERSEWSSPRQVKTRFPNASIIKDNRMVFNIKGNSFRLVVWINYYHQAIYLKWFGTHAEYDRIDAAEVGL